MTYNYQSALPGESFPFDNDLLLWLPKKLTPHLVIPLRAGINKKKIANPFFAYAQEYNWIPASAGMTRKELKSQRKVRYDKEQSYNLIPNWGYNIDRQN